MDSASTATSSVFRQEFLLAGGLHLVVGVLGRDFIGAADIISYDIRQGCCLVALQLARFLLCGQCNIDGLADVATSSTDLQTTPIKVSPFKIQTASPVKAVSNHYAPCLIYVVNESLNRQAKLLTS